MRKAIRAGTWAQFDELNGVMTKNKKAAADEAAIKEMEGVPEHLREAADDVAANADTDRIAMLEDHLANAKQEVLYAQAETKRKQPMQGAMPRPVLPATYCRCRTI
jgi:hypothetical protein